MNALELLSSAAALELGKGSNDDDGEENPRVAGVKRKASSSNHDMAMGMTSSQSVSHSRNVPASLASILSSSPQGHGYAQLPTIQQPRSQHYVVAPPPTPLPEDSGIIRCFCGFDDDDGFTIQCERCFGWQHGLCVDISPDSVPDVYICPGCLPLTTRGSGAGVTARDIERAKRLQTLRKEAENGLRREQLATPLYAMLPSSSSSSSPFPYQTQQQQDQDIEYELLAKARGLAYQKSLDSIDPTGTLILPLPPSPTHPHQQQQQYSLANPSQSPSGRVLPLLPLPPDAHTPIPYANPNRNQGIVNPFLPKSRQQQQHSTSTSQSQQQRSPPNANANATRRERSQTHLQAPLHAPLQGPVGNAGQPSSSNSADSNTKRQDSNPTRRAKSGSPAHPLTALAGAGASGADASTQTTANSTLNALQPPAQIINTTSERSAHASNTNTMMPPPSSVPPPPKQQRRRGNQHSISLLQRQQKGEDGSTISGSPGTASLPSTASAAATAEQGIQTTFSAPAAPPPPSSRRRRSAGSALSQSISRLEGGKDLSGGEKDLQKEKERETMLAMGVATLQAGSLLSGSGGNLGSSASSTSGANAAGTGVPGSAAQAQVQPPLSASARPVRAARVQATASMALANASDNYPPSAGNNNASVITTTGGGTPTNGRDAFLSDDNEEEDEDDGYEERYEPWMYEYTPISRLRWADSGLEKECKTLVERYLEEEVENLVVNGDATTEQTSNLGSNKRAGGGGLLLGSATAAASLFSSSTQQRLRTISPAPSSGSSTPAYSSSGVASAVSSPVLPVIITTPLPSSLLKTTSDFGGNSSSGGAKFTVKPLASTSLSLAPPACNPFSAPTCVTSLMNPYPRPTIHAVFSSTSLSSGSLISLMHGEVLSGDEYRNDSMNQWRELGVMKNHTRGVGMPWDLVLDQRRWGDETRFIRQGCHPNVFVRPIIVKKEHAGIMQEKGGAKRGKKRKLAASRRENEGNNKGNEGGEYELAFGLYALQDIGKREELVLPFDWADDHVVHSLHALLFSPSLVFPTIPSNVRNSGHSSTSEEDDGIPSTSSFTYLSSNQKHQITKCTNHLYRLSRLASVTCLTLLGTTICACEKRRDCAIGWLWKLGSFTESSSKNKGNLIKIQDFDLNGLRNACSSALATEEKGAAGGQGGGGKNGGRGKKMGRRRRADLGALVGLPRGWRREEGVEFSAIPTADEEEQQEAQEEKLVEDDNEQGPQMVLDGAEKEPLGDQMEVDKEVGPVIIDSSTDTTAASADAIVDDAPDAQTTITPDVTLKPVPAPADVDREQTVKSPSIPPILQDLAPFASTSEQSSSKALVEDGLPSVAATSIPSGNIEEGSDSDSDLTEPLPSGGEEEEAVRPRSAAAAVPVKSTVPQQADSTKPKSKGKTVAKKVIVEEEEEDDDMDIEQEAEEEVVRPPKKNKVTPKESKKPSAGADKKIKDTASAEKDTKTVKEKFKAKTKDKTGKKDGRDKEGPKRTKSGSGLPAFRKKSAVLEEGKMQQQTQKANPPATAPLASPSASNTPIIPGILQSLVADKDARIQQQPNSTDGPALDTLFDAALPPAAPFQSSLAVEEQGLSANTAIATTGASDDDMQIDDNDATAPPSPHKAVAAESLPISVPVVDKALSTLATESLQQEAPPAPTPAPAPPRRVSFQAYKQRTLTVSKPAIAGEAIAEEPASATTPTLSADNSRAPVQSDTGSVSPTKEAETSAMFDSAIVDTPILEKTQAESELSNPVPTGRSEVHDTQPGSAAEPIKAKSPSPAPGFVPPPPPAPPRARLSFAAYRQRLSTTPLSPSTPPSAPEKVLPEPERLVQSPAETPAIVPDLPSQLVEGVKVEKEREVFVEPKAPVIVSPEKESPNELVRVAQEPVEPKGDKASNAILSRALVPASVPADLVNDMQIDTPAEHIETAVSINPEAPRNVSVPTPPQPEEEEEQEEGEVWVDPDLEPGEVVSEADELAKEQAREDEQQRRVEEESRGRALASPVLHTPANDRSLTPPPRKRSLTPPPRRRSLTPPPRRTSLSTSLRSRTPPRTDMSYNRTTLRESEDLPTAYSRGLTPPPREMDRREDIRDGMVQQAAAPPLNEITDTPALSRFRPVGIQRVPRPLSPPPGPPPSAPRVPPTGPRGTSGPGSGYWPASGRGGSGRGSGTFTGTPSGRGRGGTPSASRDNRDTGGFGTSGGGGSSYRPEGAGQGPPPSAPRADREPPSGPRALQGRGEAPPYRGGRGGYHPPSQGIPSGPASMMPRDKGWGNRGRGQSRGRGRGGYRE